VRVDGNSLADVVAAVVPTAAVATDDVWLHTA